MRASRPVTAAVNLNQSQSGVIVSARLLTDPVGSALRAARRDAAPRQCLALTGFLLLGLVLTGTAFGQAPGGGAEGPTISAGVLSRLVFTDNLFLSATNTESDFIVQVVPNITGGRAGSRLNYRFYYGPSLVYYGDHSDLNQVFHVLQADSAAQLIDEYLGVRATARANQVLVDPTGRRAGFDALGNPDAFTQAWTVSVTPVIRLPVVRGDFATLQVEPGLNYVFNDDSLGRSQSRGTAGSISTARLKSGEMFGRSSWWVDYRTNIFDVDDDRRYSELSATYAYPFTDQLELQVLGGYDDGNYNSQRNTSTSRWRVTPVWSPSRDTSVALGYGRRFDGDDWFLRLNHRITKMVLRAEFERSLSDARSDQATRDVVQFEDAFGDPIRDPAINQDLNGSIDNAPIADGVFLLESLRAALNYRLGRTGLSVQLTRDVRDYQASGRETTDGYAWINFSRSLNPRTSAGLLLNLWDHQEGVNSDFDFMQYQVSLIWSYRLNERAQTSARYSFQDRSSDSGFQDFDENRVFLTLNWSL